MNAPDKPSPGQTTDQPETAGPDLQGALVFLSASFPKPGREPDYFATANHMEIDAAVVALVRAVLMANGRILFGGHPDIVPLVLKVAQEFKPERHAPIVLFQSTAFHDHVPPATQRLMDWEGCETEWVPLVNGEAPRWNDGVLDPASVKASLLAMREKMIAEPMIAAVFIGGMGGITEEAETVKKHPNRPRLYFIGHPGGAAREHVKEGSKPTKASGIEYTDLAEMATYPVLMNGVVRDLVHGA